MASLSVARNAHASLMAFAAKYKGARSSIDVTHTLITSPFGKFCVPADQQPAFRHLYHVALIYGQAPGFVEIKPRAAFRLFLDMDIKLPKDRPRMTDEDRLRMLECVHKTAVTMFGAAEALVAACTPYPKENIFKSGVHVVWPNIFVTQDVAMGFRHACIEALSSGFKGLGRLIGDWDDIIDETVYRDGTGLRMIGAAKANRIATAYLPELRLDAQGGIQMLGSVDEKFSSIPEWLAQCSLCVREDATNKSIVVHALPPGTVTPRPAAKQQQQRAKKGQTSCLQSEVWVTSADCSELVEAIRSMVSDSRAQELKGAAVMGVKPYIDPMFGACAIVRLNSKRCLNLREKGSHANNHTYLVAQSGNEQCIPRVCQRCHSMRKVGVYYGQCCSVNINISMSQGFSDKPMLVSDEELGKARSRLPKLLSDLCTQAGVAAAAHAT